MYALSKHISQSSSKAPLVVLELKMVNHLSCALNGQVVLPQPLFEGPILFNGHQKLGRHNQSGLSHPPLPILQHAIFRRFSDCFTRRLSLAATF